MADDSKDAHGDPNKKGGGSANLNANAKPFETCGSPTLDPYSGQFAISTKPGHVPPAQIPPAAQVPPRLQTSKQGAHATLQPRPGPQGSGSGSHGQQRSMNRPNYPQQQQQQGQFEHPPVAHGDAERRMYNKQQQQRYPNQMGPHMGHPQGYPPMQQGYPPNYKGYPMPPAHAQRHPQMARGYPPNQQYAQRQMVPPHGPQGVTTSPPHALPNGMPKTSGDAKTSANGHPKPNVSPNGVTSGGSATKASSNTPSKVTYKTYTTAKNARPVGTTMAYKTPSRSHYGQPDTKLKDAKFTNPPSLMQTQRWELLESAKRWLPGEGTLITWKKHRYLIGPPIHMGMNGHIHYCYKYPVPPRLRTGKEDGKDDDEEMDPSSPCVETLAAKIVPNTPAFAREIVILRALQECENVTELYEVLESERTLISILELAQADVYNFFVGRGSTRHGWNLEKPAVREHFSKMVISNVVQGLEQMHKAQYLHCDLKSLNILLYIYVTDHSNRRGGVYIKAKLTDFGHSSHGVTRIAEKLFSNGMARVGTAGHVAPELFSAGNKCTYKIDIWSLGIVMFSMLVPGRLIFSEYTNLEALKRGYDRVVKMNPYSKDRPSWWTDFERLSPEARDLILWMTRYDAAQRPTCEQILKHPWFLIGKQGHREHYRAKLKYVDMLCSSSIAQE